MSATLIVRHTVADYAAWRRAYDSAAAVRDKHGCTGQKVMRDPGNANDVAVTHNFPTLAQAQSFAADPELKAAMTSGGVAGPPRIEIFEDI